VEQKSVSDTVVLRTITDWNIAVAAVNRTLRGLLPAYDGYECKEPEPGKFTLTFRCGPGPPPTSKPRRWCLLATCLLCTIVHSDRLSNSARGVHAQRPHKAIPADMAQRATCKLAA